VVDLRAELKRRGCDATGLKAVLVKRLQELEAENTKKRPSSASSSDDSKPKKSSRRSGKGDGADGKGDSTSGSGKGDSTSGSGKGDSAGGSGGSRGEGRGKKRKRQAVSLVTPSQYGSADDDSGRIEVGSLGGYDMPRDLAVALRSMSDGMQMRVVACLGDGHCLWRAVAKACSVSPAEFMEAFVAACEKEREAVKEHFVVTKRGSSQMMTIDDDLLYRRKYSGLVPANPPNKRFRTAEENEWWPRSWCGGEAVEWGDFMVHGPIIAGMLGRPVVYIGIDQYITVDARPSCRSTNNRG
jgi:hypothetical protein